MLDSPFCFEIALPEELYKRVDCKYYNPKTIKEVENFRKYRIQNSKIEKLGKIAITSGGKRLPKCHSYSEDKSGRYYLRVTDFRDHFRRGATML